nr:hypothetical protein [uncultured Caproiciproducens sp.]
MISRNDVETINDIALQMISIRNFSAAQYNFRQNAKKNPSFLTFNNLGVYYITEGIELPNGKVHSARKLGLKYLKRAEAYSQSQLNLMAIGDVYFNEKSYDVASDYFRRACKFNDYYISLNNLGASLYMLGKYEEASTNFQNALSHCNCSDYSDIYPAKSTIYSSYAFSVVHYNKEESLDILHRMLKSDISHIEVDEFVLAYLCNDLLLAKKLCQRMFDSWHVDASVMAMVFDCLFMLKEGNEAEKYLNYQLKHLAGYDYNTKPEIYRLKKSFSQHDYRKEEIANFQYSPPLIKGCHYVGSK